jgi:hypothetical protein
LIIHACKKLIPIGNRRPKSLISLEQSEDFKKVFRPLPGRFFDEPCYKRVTLTYLTSLSTFTKVCCRSFKDG